MGMFTDNITSKPSWEPLYYLMVLRTSKYDEEGTLPTIRHIGPIPALAFAYYMDEVNADIGTLREHVYQYYLQDSFGRDALDFCERQYTQRMKESDVEEKEMTK